MSEGWQGWAAGQRVVVRRRLPPGAPDGHLYTDVLGHVVAVDAGGVTLLTDPPARARRAPEHVRVPAAEIVLGKVVPERPARPPRPAG